MNRIQERVCCATSDAYSSKDLNTLIAGLQSALLDLVYSLSDGSFIFSLPNLGFAVAGVIGFSCVLFFYIYI